jgi:hypothetical protein
MGKPANKTRGEIAIPALGDGVFVRFTMDAIERLCSEYPDGWANAVASLESIDQMPLMKAVLRATLVAPNEDIDLTPVAGAFFPVCELLKEAMSYSMYGKSRQEALDEFEAKQVEEVQKKLERLNEDPQMAAAIAFLQKYESQVTAPGSNQPKSAA